MVIDDLKKAIFVKQGVFFDGDYVQFRINGDDTDLIEGEIVGLTKKKIAIQRENSVCVEAYSLLDIDENTFKKI